MLDMPCTEVSGICNEMATGLLLGICANAADVGEKAAAAERFEPVPGAGRVGGVGEGGRELYEADE
jgi:hypothetical protein